ncbi:hypothetical protein [Thermoclostridium stercorarium]|uniref:hypothetical protein n=1 Tax=Thermoclostridium stercorarium TaxID=1510 RepID=UPI000A67D5A5|nr:hypothetical protein [Thermoclostridium stercorarium]
MRRRREKVLMLIVPVILLIILIILYRQFNKNGGTDGSITPFTTPTHAPTRLRLQHLLPNGREIPVVIK